MTELRNSMNHGGARGRTEDTKVVTFHCEPQYFNIFGTVVQCKLQLRQ